MFGKQLSGIVKFGKTLQHGAEKFGKGLSATASKIGGGIASAQRIVGKIEKVVGNVPVLGAGVKAIGGALGTAKSIADVASTGGQGLTALAQGDFKGVKGAFDQGKRQLGEVVKNAEGTMASGASAVEQGAILL